ncbi:hypothetical protein MHYP_G00362210 [Metynnis hypsauchen]
MKIFSFFIPNNLKGLLWETLILTNCDCQDTFSVPLTHLMPAFSPPGGHSSLHTIMATRRPARIPEDLARDMILNGWDEEPIGGIDSGSDISDVEDPEYCPSGHVRPSETQSAPAEQDQSDTEESSESSEEEMDIVSNRMSRKGSYWAELPPTQAKTPSHNLLRSQSGPY